MSKFLNIWLWPILEIIQLCKQAMAAMDLILLTELLTVLIGNKLLKSRSSKNPGPHKSTLPQISNFGREFVEKSGVQIPVKARMYLQPHYGNGVFGNV